MELKIVIGRAKSGKSDYLYNDALNKLKLNSGANFLYIVPEQMTYSTELDMINKIGGNGLLDMQIISFKKLEYMISDELGGLKLQSINDYGKIMLLKKICEDSIEELSVYKKALHRDGFLREFNSFIKELKKNEIDVSKLESIDLSNIKSELLKRKLSDIINIYKKMELATEDKYFDDEDKTKFFIGKMDKSNIIKNSYIYIDNFESLSIQRLNVIRKLIENSKGVIISINLDNNCLDNLESIDDYEVFKITHDSYVQFRNLAIEIGVKPQIINLEKSFIDNKEIRAIDDNMFIAPALKYNYSKDLKSVQVFSSMNTYTEIENVCIKIISLVRDKGYRYRDIAVVSSAMDTYSKNIQKLFMQYDIPVFIDLKKDIMNNPLIKYILSILDMFNYNFKHQSVFECLKTGFLNFDYAEVDKLENYALEFGIEGNKWFKPFKYKGEDVLVEYYENLRKKFANDFEKLRKEFSKLKTADKITEFLYNRFNEHNVLKSIENKVNEFRKNGLYELSLINAQIWNIIIEIFEQITLTSKDVVIAPIQYKKILEAGLSEIELSIIPPTLDKVVAGDLDRAFINNYRAVFLIGANEGVLLSQGEDKGILLDEEKDSLNDLGLKLQNTSSYNDNKEKHFLYRVLTKPKDCLYISYALSTIEGRSLQASMYIDRLNQIFPNLIIESDLSNNDEMNFVMTKKSTLNVLIEKLREYIEGKPLSELWENVYSWYKQNNHELAYIIDSGIDYKNIVENIKDTDIDKLYGESLTMSVSKLENFASCPFKFFLDFGIKPFERKELRIEYYDIGNIFHDCIEKFTKLIIAKDTKDKYGNGVDKVEFIDPKTIVKEKVSEHMDNCINEVLKSNFSNNNALEYNERNKYIKEKIKRLLDRAAWTMVSQLKKGNFEPKFTEFEVKSALNNQLSIEGRIDRLDIFEDNDNVYINIVDYKSSKKDIILSDVMGGLQLQLFVYMSSILKGEIIEKHNNKIGGAFYFDIDDPFINADNIVAESYEDEIFKELSLRGYVLEDMKVIENIDSDIQDTKASNIIPVALKTDGSLTKSSRALNEDEYSLILNKVDSIATELSNEILCGKIDINPYRKNTNITPCSYCSYRTVCQFDSSIDGNKYRYIKKTSKEEIISNLQIENNLMIEKGEV
jgi:ATP-dependent helicase/nuclease subunit B